MLDDTTIVAVATPPGRGGIGVVRLSGTSALPIAHRLVPKLSNTAPRTAIYAILRDADGARMDDAIVICYTAPYSYTGEDVVEIATHGSPVVLDWLIRACVDLGATPARAGEFTERAFLRGRLDLTEAEAVRDLIDAHTVEQAKLAARQMSGSIAATVRPAKAALITLIATLEAGIDFAEDDTPVLHAEAITTSLANALEPLEALLASFAHGRLLRDGMQLAIVGKPNAGKSSLFNRLVEQERAIVTAMPGTTRDVIAERVSINGVPVELLDTAGLRDAEDEVERMGVERSRKALADADAVLLVVDSSDTAPLEPALLTALEGRTCIVAINKTDVQPVWFVPEALLQLPAIQTSALTGAGIAELRAAIVHAAGGTGFAAGSATLTNLRQRDTVRDTVKALQRARLAAASHTPHEMILLDIYEALHSLDELTGQTTPDDILNLIFSSFCIGK